MKPSPLVRIVKHYRRVGGTTTHVQVSWREKWVPDPDNPWHLKHAKGWKRRTRKLTIDQLHKHFRVFPPHAHEPF